MSNIIVEYTFLESNKETLIFVPGYSGGLEISIIKHLVDYFLQQGDCNIFGLNLDYQNDIQDEFKKSQEDLIKAVDEIYRRAPNSRIILLAKSLGGSLAIFNLDKLLVSKIVILGSAVVLGWPQRISLLKSEKPVIPDYRNEWGKTLMSINVPTLVLSGSSDDLADNKYLSEIAEYNRNLRVVVIKNANHNLEDIDTKEIVFDKIIKNILSTFAITDIPLDYW